MKKGQGTKHRVPIVFLLLAFTLTCSLNAAAQFANNIPDKVANSATITGNTSDNSNIATITFLQSDASGTATFTVKSREGGPLAANQLKAYTAPGAYVWTTSVKWGGATKVDAPELSSRTSDGPPPVGTWAAYPVTSADSTHITVSAPAGITFTTRANLAASGSIAVWFADLTTGQPGQKYGGDMGCLGCHSMASDPLQHNAQQIAGTGGYTDCIDASILDPEVNPKAVCGPVDRNGYILTGHKNMLRKVLPPSATPYGANPLAPTAGMLGPDGTTLAGSINLNLGSPAVSTPFTLDWINGTATGGGNSSQLLYVFGWVNPPDVLFRSQGSSVNYTQGNTANYTCARCHTTGYRFDGTAQEPTTTSVVAGVNTYTDLSDNDLSRIPNGWACTKTDPATGKAWTNYKDCAAAGGLPATSTSSWMWTGIQCERCHNNTHLRKCADVGVAFPTIAGTTVSNCEAYFDTTGAWRATNKPYQPVNVQATALCLQCHRTEVTSTSAHTITPAQVPGGYKDNGSCSDPTKTSYAACVAPATWNYKPGFSSHGTGQQFLNSPHGKYTGTLALNKQNSVDLSLAFNGSFASHFTDEGQGKSETGFTLGEPEPNNNGGCANCHNVHYSAVDPATVDGVAPQPFTRECISCHAEHNQGMAHPTGPGTPFPDGFGQNNQESCVICHMQGAAGSVTNHYFRINESASYSTFATPADYYAAGGNTTTPQAPLTRPDSSGYAAVSQDVDIACGQCHVGGTTGVNPYGITPPTPQPGAMVPVAYSRAFLAEKAANMHNTQAPAPTLSPAPGTFLSGSAPVSVTLSSVDGTTIYYTTDGTTPTTASTAYAAPIAVNSNTTIYAIAAGQPWSYRPSTVAGGAYTILTLAKPTFLPSAGNYTTASASVTLSGPSGSTMYYTKDGSVPTFPVTGTTTQYTGPIVLNSYTILKAIATAPGFAPSAVATSGAYSFKLATPTFSNVGAKYPGSYSLVAQGGSVTVKLNDTTVTATICYTTNGTTPTAAAGVCTNGTSIAAGGTFTLSTPGVVTVKAIAAAPNYTNSNMVSGTYSLY